MDIFSWCIMTSISKFSRVFVGSIFNPRERSERCSKSILFSSDLKLFIYTRCKKYKAKVFQKFLRDRNAL